MRRPDRIRPEGSRWNLGWDRWRPRWPWAQRSEDRDSKAGTPVSPARPDPEPSSSESGESAETSDRPQLIAAPISAAEARRSARRERRRRQKFERDELRRHSGGVPRRLRRRVLLAFGIAMTVVAIVASVVTSPLLRVRDIVVQGTQRLDASSIEEALQPEVGRLIAFVDQGDVASRLQSFALIQSISLTSELPSTLVVTITERSPLGVEQTDSGWMLFDAAGVPIETVADRPDGYPEFQVSAVSEDDVGFRSAVSVYQSLPEAVRTQVSIVSAHTQDDVELTLSSGVIVVWGDAEESDFKGQVLDAVLKQAPGATKIDLSAPKLPVVTQ